MLPPPTTAASSTPSATTAAISLARWKTTSGEIPSGSFPEKASPESFTTTRFQRRCAFGASGSGQVSAWAAVCPGLATGSARTAVPAWCAALPSMGCSPLPPLTSWLRPSFGLADLEPREGADGNPLIGEQLLDGLLRVPDERLLGQHHVLEERVKPALDDLRDRLLRLALVPGDLLHDAALVLDHVRGHLVAGQVLRPHRGHLVRHIPG